MTEEIKVSFFDAPIRNTKPTKSVSIMEAYRMIRGEGENNPLPKLTESLRSIGDQKERQKFKGDHLPYITFGGEFSERRNDHIVKTSGFLILDFDHLPEDELRDFELDIRDDEDLCPKLIFRSPSGDGLKVVVRLKQEVSSPEEYEKCFLTLQDYFRRTQSVEVDRSGKDISRACYLCYDPEAILMADEGPGFDVEKWAPQPQKPTRRTSSLRPLGMSPDGSMIYDSAINDITRAERAVEDIESSGIDITDYYEDWRDIGFALGNLGEAGRELFHRVSQMSPKYDHRTADKQFDRSLNDGGIGLNTLFHIATERGVILRPSMENRPERIAPGGHHQTTAPAEGRVQEKPHQRTEFPELLKPLTEDDIRKWESSIPDAMKTGYQVEDEDGGRQDLLIPSAKLTGIAGPTGHGKSLFLMNLLLNVARLNPDKNFILLTYEENAETVTEYLLNIYLEDLNLTRYGGNVSNRIRLSEYFKGNLQEFNRDNRTEFELRKNSFFDKYIKSGRILIKYITHTSDELCRALEYISDNRNRIGGVFVDYFQCINPSDEMAKKTRQEALKSICFDLKDTANRTGLPIVLGAQFNQEVLSPTDIGITKVGEAGDISRILSELWGLWQMGKKIGRELKKSDEQKLKELEEQDETIRDNRDRPHLKGMYIRVLKSRLTATESEMMLEFRGLTGKIYPNSNDSEIMDQLENDWKTIEKKLI